MVYMNRKMAGLSGANSNKSENTTTAGYKEVTIDRLLPLETHSFHKKVLKKWEDLKQKQEEIMEESGALLPDKNEGNSENLDWKRKHDITVE